MVIWTITVVSSWMFCWMLIIWVEVQVVTVCWTMIVDCNTICSPCPIKLLDKYSLSTVSTSSM